jgi:hypothetical protein
MHAQCREMRTEDGYTCDMLCNIGRMNCVDGWKENDNHGKNLDEHYGCHWQNDDTVCQCRLAPGRFTNEKACDALRTGLDKESNEDKTKYRVYLDLPTECKA